MSLIDGAENVRREPNAEIPSFIHCSPTGTFGKSNVPVTLLKSGSDENTTDDVKSRTNDNDSDPEDSTVSSEL